MEDRSAAALANAGLFEHRLLALDPFRLLAAAFLLGALSTRIGVRVEHVTGGGEQAIALVDRQHLEQLAVCTHRVECAQGRT